MSPPKSRPTGEKIWSRSTSVSGQPAAGRLVTGNVPRTRRPPRCRWCRAHRPGQQGRGTVPGVCRHCDGPSLTASSEQVAVPLLTLSVNERGHMIASDRFIIKGEVPRARWRGASVFTRCWGQRSLIPLALDLESLTPTFCVGQHPNRAVRESRSLHHDPMPPVSPSLHGEGFRETAHFHTAR